MKPTEMDRRTLALVIAGLLIAFLLGFVPQWMAKRDAHRSLAEARLELRLSRQQGRLGAALSESLRSNYERARQLMAAYFTDLQGTVGAVEDPRRRQTLNGILAQRDEIITQLSRAQPESSQRLMLLYTSMFTAVDPQGAVGTTVTPPPPPPPPSDSAAPPARTSPPARPQAAPRPAPAPARPAGARP
jgi:type II secretory pathway pseudopilin PulG